MVMYNPVTGKGCVRGQGPSMFDPNDWLTKNPPMTKIDEVFKTWIAPRKVPTKDDYYISLAFLVSKRSKDPNTQCGAILVSKDNRPLGIGYNGAPRKIRDSSINWARPDKYPFMVHSEVNAIRHAKGDIVGATLYVTGKPCSACMLQLVNYEIDKVVYYDGKVSDKSSMLHNDEIWNTTQTIAQLGGVELVPFSGKLIFENLLNPPN